MTTFAVPVSRTSNLRARPFTRQRADIAPDESMLVARLRRRDPFAFADLLRLAGDRMLAVARPMVHNEEDAQDAVQEAFMSAFKAIDRFDGRARLTTWLHRITVNVCLMRLRSKRRHPERPIDDLMPCFDQDGHHADAVAPWTRRDTGRLEQEETLALVRSMMCQLPTHYRAVLILRDVQGLDTGAAALALGVSSDVVKIRLHRARQALRTLLDPLMQERPASTIERAAPSNAVAPCAQRHHGTAPRRRRAPCRAADGA